MFFEHRQVAQDVGDAGGRGLERDQPEPLTGRRRDQRIAGPVEARHVFVGDHAELEHVRVGEIGGVRDDPDPEALGVLLPDRVKLTPLADPGDHQQRAVPDPGPGPGEGLQEHPGPLARLHAAEREDRGPIPPAEAPAGGVTIERDVGEPADIHPVRDHPRDDRELALDTVGPPLRARHDGVRPAERPLHALLGGGIRGRIEVMHRDDDHPDAPLVAQREQCFGGSRVFRMANVGDAVQVPGNRRRQLVRVRVAVGVARAYPHDAGIAVDQVVGRIADGESGHLVAVLDERRRKVGRVHERPKRTGRSRDDEHLHRGRRRRRPGRAAGRARTDGMLPCIAEL